MMLKRGTNESPKAGSCSAQSRHHREVPFVYTIDMICIRNLGKSKAKGLMALTTAVLQSNKAPTDSVSNAHWGKKNKNFA